ncbi:MAG: hypothetical protein ABJA60_06595 [Nitrosospira sp.]
MADIQENNEAGIISVDNTEWYFQVGYVEILYAAMVVGVFVALYFFRRLDRMAGFVATVLEEGGILLGLLGLAVALFVINRVLGDLW